MAYLSTADFKTYKGITASGDDTLIGDLITAAQAAIDSYTGRTFEGSNANRTFDSLRDVDGVTLYLDQDLASIASITNGDGTSLTSSDYTTEPRNVAPYYAIRLLASSGYAWQADATTGNHEDAITVNGVWAYSATAPAEVVQATRRLVAWLYEQRNSTGDLDRPLMGASGVVIMPSALPRDVMQLLAPFRRRV